MNGTKNIPTHSEPAKAFASSSPGEPEAALETYRVLNDSAHEKAKVVSSGGEALSAAWADLLPTLDEMQSFLSQRGEARGVLRDATLPGWMGWLDSFTKESGLNVTVRTVQNHLRKYRSLSKPMDKENRKRPAPPVHLSNKDRLRLLEGALHGNNLVAALENSADYSEPMREFKRVAMNQDRIGQLIENQPTDEAFTLVSATTRGPAAVSPIPKTYTPAVSQVLALSHHPSRMLMPGDWAGLARFTTQVCGFEIKATLEGLEPELRARVFGRFVNELAKTYCLCDDGAEEDEENTRNVDSASSSSPAFERAA